METVSKLHFQLSEAEFRFRRACEQVVLLNNKLGEQQIRYDRARRDQMKSYRYNIRLRMSSLEGVRNVYYEYARQKADTILALRQEIRCWVEGQSNGKCHFKRADVGATLKSWVDLPKGSEFALQKAVAVVGLISVAIDASQASYQFYKNGVYYDPHSNNQQLDHANLITGYGVYEGSEYWMVKDSWGTYWGMNGYVMIARNRNNTCGIATIPSYPVV